MKQRKVTERQVEETLTNPDKLEPGDNGGDMAIRRYGGREVRIVYDEPEENCFVIYTVIKPRARYW